MRGLIGSDLFKAMRIIKYAGVQEEIEKIALATADGKPMKQSEVGAKIIISCVTGCSNPKAEAEIWSFLGDLMEISADELKNMEIDALMNKIEELAEYISRYDFADFFKRLSALMGLKQSS